MCVCVGGGGGGGGGSNFLYFIFLLLYILLCSCFAWPEIYKISLVWPNARYEENPFYTLFLQRLYFFLKYE